MTYPQLVSVLLSRAMCFTCPQSGLQAMSSAELSKDLDFESLHPMTFMHLSGICAMTRLIQCHGLGVEICEVSHKFLKNFKDI